MHYVHHEFKSHSFHMLKYIKHQIDTLYNLFLKDYKQKTQMVSIILTSIIVFNFLEHLDLLINKIVKKLMYLFTINSPKTAIFVKLLVTFFIVITITMLIYNINYSIIKIIVNFLNKNPVDFDSNTKDQPKKEDLQPEKKNMQNEKKPADIELVSKKSDYSYNYTEEGNINTKNMYNEREKKLYSRHTGRTSNHSKKVWNPENKQKILDYRTRNKPEDFQVDLSSLFSYHRYRRNLLEFRADYILHNNHHVNYGNFEKDAEAFLNGEKLLPSNIFYYTNELKDQCVYDTKNKDTRILLNAKLRNDFQTIVADAWASPESDM